MTRNPRPITAVTEVAEFERARNELEGFKAANQQFFDDLQVLVERYNAAQQKADKAVRVKMVSCGPWELSGVPTIKWDADKLYEEMGHDFFAEHGGSEKRALVRSIDKATIEAAYSQGLVPKEVADACRCVTPRYSFPKPVEVP